jgi:hypothetical protein
LQEEALAGVIEKMRKNQIPKILFYGDSITVSANSSGVVNDAPFADIWAKMVFDSMTRKYQQKRNCLQLPCEKE